MHFQKLATMEILLLLMDVIQPAKLKQTMFVILQLVQMYVTNVEMVF